MPTTLNANQCPAPVVNDTFNSIVTARNATGADGAEVLYTLIQGATTFASNWNANALSIELIGRKGCGAYCIMNGLAISIGVSALTIGVSQGQALVDGVVEVAATSINVPDNTARVYIWLKQDGTLTYGTSTSVPTGGKVFLGSCVTSGGAVTSVDTSGVLYSRGGMAIRQTNDSGVPSDTPGSLAFLTIAQNGTYLWNGSAYTLLFTNSQLTEYVQDVAGAMFTNSTGITWTYNDGAGTVSAAFNLTAFTTDSLPEGSGNLYFTDARARTAVIAQQLPYPVSSSTVTADVTLATTSHNVQAISASGANRNVYLPATLTFGNWFRVWNIGTTNSLILRSNNGSSTLGTVGVSQYADINPVISSGSAAWPATVSINTPGTPL